MTGAAANDELRDEATGRRASLESEAAPAARMRPPLQAMTARNPSERSFQPYPAPPQSHMRSIRTTLMQPELRLSTQELGAAIREHASNRITEEQYQGIIDRAMRIEEEITTEIGEQVWTSRSIRKQLAYEQGRPERYAIIDALGALERAHRSTSAAGSVISYRTTHTANVLRNLPPRLRTSQAAIDAMTSGGGARNVRDWLQQAPPPTAMEAPTADRVEHPTRSPPRSPQQLPDQGMITAVQQRAAPADEEAGTATQREVPARQETAPTAEPESRKRQPEGEAEREATRPRIQQVLARIEQILSTRSDSPPPPGTRVTVEADADEPEAATARQDKGKGRATTQSSDDALPSETLGIETMSISSSATDREPRSRRGTSVSTEDVLSDLYGRTPTPASRTSTATAATGVSASTRAAGESTSTVTTATTAKPRQRRPSASTATSEDTELLFNFRGRPIRGGRSGLQHHQLQPPPDSGSRAIPRYWQQRPLIDVGTTPTPQEQAPLVTTTTPRASTSAAAASRPAATPPQHFFDPYAGESGEVVVRQVDQPLGYLQTRNVPAPRVIGEQMSQAHREYFRELVPRGQPTPRRTQRHVGWPEPDVQSPPAWPEDVVFGVRYDPPSRVPNVAPLENPRRMPQGMWENPPPIEGEEGFQPTRMRRDDRKQRAIQDQPLPRTSFNRQAMENDVKEWRTNRHTRINEAFERVKRNVLGAPEAEKLFHPLHLPQFQEAVAILPRVATESVGELKDYPVWVAPGKKPLSRELDIDDEYPMIESISRKPLYRSYFERYPAVSDGELSYALERQSEEARRRIFFKLRELHRQTQYEHVFVATRYREDAFADLPERGRRRCPFSHELKVREHPYLEFPEFGFFPKYTLGMWLQHHVDFMYPSAFWNGIHEMLESRPWIFSLLPAPRMSDDLTWPRGYQEFALTVPWTLAHAYKLIKEGTVVYRKDTFVQEPLAMLPIAVSHLAREWCAKATYGRTGRLLEILEFIESRRAWYQADYDVLVDDDYEQRLDCERAKIFPRSYKADYLRKVGLDNPALPLDLASLAFVRRLFSACSEGTPAEHNHLVEQCLMIRPIHRRDVYHYKKCDYRNRDLSLVAI